MGRRTGWVPADMGRKYRFGLMLHCPPSTLTSPLSRHSQEWHLHPQLHLPPRFHLRASAPTLILILTCLESPPPSPPLTLALTRSAGRTLSLSLTSLPAPPPSTSPSNHALRGHYYALLLTHINGAHKASARVRVLGGVASPFAPSGFTARSKVQGFDLHSESTPPPLCPTQKGAVEGTFVALGSPWYVAY